MRAESRLVVSVIFGKENELRVIENFLICAEDFFPSIIPLVIGRNCGLDEAVFFFGDDFRDLEVGMARF
jgi:hypothetical protein